MRHPAGRGPASGNPDNTYADPRRAAAYAGLEFPGTYYLAYRDLPGLLGDGGGRRALDFGCGAGRSTRFLRTLGFDPTGVDISAEMIERARRLDPEGTYVLIEDGNLDGFPPARYDLVLAVFTFDNIPDAEHRVRLLAGLGRRLSRDGRLVLVDSTPDLYAHEWASFSTREFPENARAGSGDTVRVIMMDVEDRRPVEDVLWFDPDYRAQFERAGLVLLDTHRPLAGPEDGTHAWVNETRIPPWVIYRLGGPAPRS